MPRQDLGIGFANMADTERKDKTIERNRAARRNRGKEIARRRLAHALAIFQLLERTPITRFKRENILRPRNQPIAIKRFDLLLAQTFNVKRITRHEMP